MQTDGASMSDFVLREVLAVGLALVILAALTYVLSRPRIQQSERYQAMVVPMANIMDVGFLVLAPAIVLLAGYGAPLVMLGICLLGPCMQHRSSTSPTTRSCCSHSLCGRWVSIPRPDWPF